MSKPERMSLDALKRIWPNKHYVDFYAYDFCCPDSPFGHYVNIWNNKAAFKAHKKPTVYQLKD